MPPYIYDTPSRYLYTKLMVGMKGNIQSSLPMVADATTSTDGKENLAVLTADGAIRLTDLQLAGKKRMDVKDFLRGFRDVAEYSVSEGTSSGVIDRYRNGNR